MDNTELIGKLKNKNMELSKLLDRIEEEPGRINDIVCLIDEMSSDTLRYEMEVEQITDREFINSVISARDNYLHAKGYSDFDFMDAVLRAVQKYKEMKI